MEKCKSILTYFGHPGVYSTHRCEHPVGHKGAHSDGLCTWTKGSK